MKYIKMFESFSREQEIKNATIEEDRIRNRKPKRNKKIQMGDRVYIDGKTHRCIESDGEGNTVIQEVSYKGGDDVLGKIITLTDTQVVKAIPVNSLRFKDEEYSDDKPTAWTIK